MANYFEKLRDPRWQKKRLEILQRDQFRCIECTDDTSTLHVHHTRYIKNRDPWDYADGFLVTLCEFCHGELHRNESSVIEHIAGTFYSRGAGWHDLWYLAYALDCSIPPTERLTSREWERVFDQVRETMQLIVEERGQ